MPGLIRGVARTAVVAGTATAVSNRVSRRPAGRWAEQEQHQACQQQPYMPPPPGRYRRPMFQPPRPQHTQQAPVYQPPPQRQQVYGQPEPPLAPEPRTAEPAAPAAPAVDDVTARLLRLRQLGELKTQGVLTDAEFEAQKRKILGA